MAWFKNKKYDNDLYFLSRHGDKESTKRTLAALDWLRSPAGECIGQQLLMDAKALHKHPLFISFDDKRPTHYDAMRHGVYINLPQIDGTYRGLNDGTSVIAASLEEVLAHELTHATQPEVLELTLNPFKIADRIQHAVQSPEERVLLGRHKQAIIDAPTYNAALKAMEDYVDARMPIDQRTAPLFQQALAADEEWQQYVKMEEAPVRNQNRVAALQGRAHRASYVEENIFADDAVYRQSLLDKAKIDFFYDYAFKPGGVDDGFFGDYQSSPVVTNAPASSGITDIDYEGHGLSRLIRGSCR